jgi:DNA-binding response OmpR family regulator
MAKILLIEDDKELATVAINWLQGENHTVDHAADGAEGRDLLKFYSYDVAIIDWELPNISGPAICKEYRTSGGSTPIIMLTGKSEIMDKVAGLDAGADDYLTKPFDPRELSARLRSLLSRPAQKIQTTLTAGDLELDVNGHSVRKAGKLLHLMPREFALLELFMKNPDKTFSADVILDRVWSSNSEVSPDIVKVYIAKLRRKIEDRDAPPVIVTVHGVGYKLQI